jgi:hypothetical protein
LYTCNSQYFFGFILAYHIFIRNFFTSIGFLPVSLIEAVVLSSRTSKFLFNDLPCMLYTVFSDMPFLASDKDLHLIPAAATKRTM